MPQSEQRLLTWDKVVERLSLAYETPTALKGRGRFKLSRVAMNSALGKMTRSMHFYGNSFLRHL